VRAARGRRIAGRSGASRRLDAASPVFAVISRAPDGWPSAPALGLQKANEAGGW
jgi:hypothetical protein